MLSCQINTSHVLLWLISILLIGCKGQKKDDKGPIVVKEDDSIPVEWRIPLELPQYAENRKVKHYSSYTVSYNSETLNPNWVAYELTREKSNGNVVTRKGYHFVQDVDFGVKQADYYDFSNSGWDKGHLAPAADMKWDATAMKDCFYFTNCCPQNHDFNSGIWENLENNVRSWARKFGKVYVVTGPIFTDNTYGKLGVNEVWIPDMFFKACLAPKGAEYIAIGFVIENGNVSGNLNSFACAVDELEDRIGMNLFFNLDDSIESVAESVVKWGEWGLAKPKGE